MVLGLVACSSGGGATSSHATLSVRQSRALYRAKRGLRAGLMAGCWTAAGEINGTGGILGHHVTCIPTDTRGDPADAVPIVRLMLAKTSNLVGVSGPSSRQCGGACADPRERTPALLSWTRARLSSTTAPTRTSGASSRLTTRPGSLWRRTRSSGDTAGRHSCSRTTSTRRATSHPPSRAGKSSGYGRRKHQSRARPAGLHR